MSEHTAGQAVLSVRDLVITYDEVLAVSGVSFDVHTGEIFGLLGPNGAGKTSTLSAIEGLVIPDSGSIVVAGLDFKDNPIKVRQIIGVALQSTSFQSELTVSEIVDLYAGLYGVILDEKQTRARLASFGIEDKMHKRFKELSGGQQQRVSLIIAAIASPKLLLLDEPTSGLDPQSRRELWSRIEEMHAAGAGVVLTTHSMEEAQAVCHRIGIIDHGKMIVVDTPGNLIERYKDHADVKAISRGGTVTLEDVFIGLTGKDVRS